MVGTVKALGISVQLEAQAAAGLEAFLVRQEDGGVKLGRVRLPGG